MGLFYLCTWLFLFLLQVYYYYWVSLLLQYRVSFTSVLDSIYFYYKFIIITGSLFYFDTGIFLFSLQVYLVSVISILGRSFLRLH